MTMMNHFFALLIILGLIFGVYKATSGVANFTERDLRIERWEAARQKAMDERENALADQPQLQSLDQLPRVDDKNRIIHMPDGTQVTPDSFTVTAGEMRQARWERLKKVGNSLTLSAVNAPQLAVTLCIEYIGLMALWLGVMRVADKAGLVRILARGLSPILRRLFPDVPRDHPAMSGMIMNIAANMLGLDNAATPLGLAAMKELQKLNPRKDTATNAMVMFIAINTSSVVILPFSILGFRAAAGSTNPQGFLVPMLLATMCSTTAAILLTPLLARFYPTGGAAADGDNGPPDDGEGGGAESADANSANHSPSASESASASKSQPKALGGTPKPPGRASESQSLSAPQSQSANA